MWRARFNGDPSLIGTTIRLSADRMKSRESRRRASRIRSRAPSTPGGPTISSTTPLSENNSLAVRPAADGRQPRAGLAELAVLSQSAKERWPDAKASSLVALPLQHDVAAPSRSLLQLLLIAVGLVLLVACVNVANLVLVRATGRVPEFAVRAALGSGRSRLARQLMVESLVLADSAASPGSRWRRSASRPLQRLGRDALPRLDAVGFDPSCSVRRVVTMATALACGVDAGASPGEHRSESRAHAPVAIRDGTRRQGRLRNGLAAAQLALALALARRRRRALGELLPPDESRPRFPRRSRSHVRRDSAERPLRRRPARHLSRRSGPATGRDPRRHRRRRDVPAPGDGLAPPGRCSSRPARWPERVARTASGSRTSHGQRRLLQGALDSSAGGQDVRRSGRRACCRCGPW